MDLTREEIEFYRNKWKGSLGKHVRLDLKRLIKDYPDVEAFYKEYFDKINIMAEGVVIDERHREVMVRFEEWKEISFCYSYIYDMKYLEFDESGIKKYL